MSFKKKLGDYISGRSSERNRTLKWLKKVTIKMNREGFSSRQIKMAESILELGDCTAREIMIPRIDVVSFDISDEQKELKNLLDENTYSRIPVFEDSIDNIKGILHVKDLYKYLIKNRNENLRKKIDLKSYMSEPYFIPESKLILDLLSEFQSLHIHFSVVVDEYGGFSGIVTMEDIIEEIIGDVQDEFDDEENEVKQLGDGKYSLDARIDLETIKKKFDIDLPAEEVDTLGGFLINHTGYIPKRNQVISYQDLKFRIMSKRKNSLQRVCLEIQNLKGEKSTLTDLPLDGDDL